MGGLTSRLLTSSDPCRGCGVASVLYDGRPVPHDEARCMRARGIRFYLGLPVGTRVLFDDGFEPLGRVASVQISTSVPWETYALRSGTSRWVALPDVILGVLPPEKADSQALERWLAHD